MPARATAAGVAGVFINCPFDAAFKPMFDAIVFAVIACGKSARSALEVQDSGEVRLEKIMRLLRECSFSIHDLSRVELDGTTGLPRFNMPIELGLALGLKNFGRTRHSLLVLDSEPFRYQKFASDLAGLDIATHNNNQDHAIKSVRNFLASTSPLLPSGAAICELYSKFQTLLPDMAQRTKHAVEDLTFTDRVALIAAFFQL